MDTLKKEQMLEALEKSLGVVSPACKAVGIARQTHYNWLKTDEVYAEAVNDISEHAIDFVESKLFNQINTENTTATIFYLKTKAKNRGYVERQEIVHDAEISSTLVEWKPSE